MNPNMISWRCCGTAVLGLCAWAAVAGAQNLDPAEVRLHAGAYFPKPAVTIQAKAELVEIGVVVRDRRGQVVRDLTKSDFEVRDDGKRREISAFSVQNFVPAGPAAAHAPAAGGAAVPAPSPAAAPEPRWVALVFDDISTAPSDLYIAKAAAKGFVRDGLAANDRVGVFTTSIGLTLPFTADAAKITAAIDKVSYRERELTSKSCPLLTPYDVYLITNHLDPMALDVKAQEYQNCSGTCQQGGSASRGGKSRGASSPAAACQEAINAVQMMASSLWEEVRLQSQNNLRTVEGIVDLLARMQGARVILLASSGFLSGTLEIDQDQITDKALRANVVINSLDAKGLYTGLESAEMGSPPGATIRSTIYRGQLGTRPKEALNDVLAVLADSTGGRFFHNRNDLDVGFKELGKQPDVSYLLGFSPETLDSKYHHLKVNLTGARHYSLQARKGYVASRDKPQVRDPQTDRRMDSEVFTNTTIQDAPVKVSSTPEKSPDGHQFAHLTFHVDVGNVQFQNVGGVRTQRIRIIATLFDNQGAFLKGMQGLMELALKEASYDRLAKTGFDANLDLDMPEGTYRLRTVVVEGDDNGRYSTASQPAGSH